MHILLFTFTYSLPIFISVDPCNCFHHSQRRRRDLYLFHQPLSPSTSFSRFNPLSSPLLNVSIPSLFSSRIGHERSRILLGSYSVLVSGCYRGWFLCTFITVMLNPSIDNLLFSYELLCLSLVLYAQHAICLCYQHLLFVSRLLELIKIRPQKSYCEPFWLVNFKLSATWWRSALVAASVWPRSVSDTYTYCCQ